MIWRDLKDKDTHRYYLAALLLTAIFFIFSGTGVINNFLILTEKLLLSTAIVAVIVIYIFVHLIAFVYESYHHLTNKQKR
jgi:antibiotic biosynthesis monooxygenase (ABM) superfamily enzyme